MIKPNDGGPAFPGDDINTHLTGNRYGGTSLRDYFAAHALAGYAQNSDNLAWTRAELAEECFAAADAMLAARTTPEAAQ